MGVITRIGLWLDKHFPEKISADEFVGQVAELSKAAKEAHETIEKIMKMTEQCASTIGTHVTQILELKDEINKIKAIIQLKATQRVNMPNLTGAEPWKR